MKIEKLKEIYICSLRKVLKILFIFPIKNNRVVFESFSGSTYNCNPKYISILLKEKYGDLVDVIWVVRKGVELPGNVVSCKYRSFKHLLYRSTSKVYVCNFLQAVEIPKRKDQIEIQTWHGGGCYKKVGVEEKARDKIYNKRRDMHVKETDYFIASSQYFEDEVIRHQFGYCGKVLETGMPRNDCLCGKTDIKKRNQIRLKSGMELDAFVVLYAPTWREGMDKYPVLDYRGVEKAFSERFSKKCQIVFRAHLYGKEKNTEVLNLTGYPDMQELLYACDALITDYSSSMWDYSLTERPCFLYVPDLKRYNDQRGFDRDIYTWGFPVCETNEKLIACVKSFDSDDFKQKMNQHQRDLRTFEMGNASEKVADLIAEICGIL